MTILQEVEQLDTGDTEGCKLRGVHREVVAPTTVNLIPFVLRADQSGALVILGNAEGAEYELPPAEAGLWFEFAATVSVTSTELYTVKCATGDFLVGAIIGGSATIAGSGGMFDADGSADLGWTSNGSTTGGLIGDNVVLTAINSTQWAITQGVMQGSGTWATPFITS